jgi:hypothetical protein
VEAQLTSDEVSVQHVARVDRVQIEYGIGGLVNRRRLDYKRTDLVRTFIPIIM